MIKIVVSEEAREAMDRFVGHPLPVVRRTDNGAVIELDKATYAALLARRTGDETASDLILGLARDGLLK